MEIHVARQVMVDDRLSQEFGSTERVDESNQSTLDGVTLQFNTPWGAVAGNARAVGAGAVGEKELVNELVWGIEYYTDGIDSSRLRTDTDSGASTQTRGRYPDDSSMESLALYAANRREWGPLAIEAGLRYSMFDISMPEEGTSPAVQLEPNDLTGDVHTAWELQPGLRLVSNIGRGFRPPNIFDLGSLGPRPGNRYNQPNPDLQPESVWSYDLGLKSVGTSWEAEFFLFYSDYRDKLTSVFTGETTPDGRLIVQSQNLNKATLYGFESGINWHFANGVDVNAALNYTHGEEQDVQAGTVPADRVPPLNGRLELTYEPGLNLRLQPWIDFAARQHRLSPRDQADPRIAPGGTPGYATFNFLLSWQATPGVELGLRLENLGDTNYREHGSGIDAPGRNFGVWLNALF
jgi:outer membrane receptor protein involved in Fe transport